MMLHTSSSCTFGVLCLFSFFLLACSTPPANPVECSFKERNCTIINSYGAFSDRATCTASMIVYPTTERDLLDAVAKGTKSKQKMRVVTQFSHSMTKLACADGNEGKLISTELLNRTISVDVDEMTITVQSGVSLRQLIADAAKFGLALRMAPHWWGLTVGGMMSTGAHGSTWHGDGSAFHDYVTEMRMVTSAVPDQGYAMVRLLNGSNFYELDSAKVSLGVFGVISQVTVQLEKMFKRSITYIKEKDRGLAEAVERLGERFEFADVTWYPSNGEVVYRMDERISSDIFGNGTYNSLLFASWSSKELATQRLIEEELQLQENTNKTCKMALQFLSSLASVSYDLANYGTTFDGYPVVGFHSNLMSSGGCLDSKEDGLATACPWDSRILGQFFHQTTFTIPIENVKDFISDINALLKIEPEALCGLNFYNGVLIRYLQPSFAYLGNEFPGMEFEFTYYRSRDPLVPRMNEDIMEEIEQMGLFKYGGLPHWGKNRNIAFIGAIEKYSDAAQFLEVKERFDPLGLFSSEWTDKILGLRRDLRIDREGCALEGECICSKDAHCAPNRGYFCRPGKIYKEARVCTYL